MSSGLTSIAASRPRTRSSRRSPCCTGCPPSGLGTGSLRRRSFLPTSRSITSQRLAELYVPPASPARTLLVSEDRYLHLWARVMDFQFGPRQHIVVRRMEDAIRLAGATREVS